MSSAPFKIYNASAGAGKTYTLAKEYIKILLDYTTNDAYKHILAITFTNKAVKEMKERIVNYLTEIAYPSKPNNPFLKDLESETGKSELWIRNKCKNVLYHIIHNYSNFGISTIDKFTQKIVRSFAPELGLSSNFEVSIDEDDLVQETIDSIMQRIGDTTHHENEELTKTLIDYSQNMVAKGNSWDISDKLIAIGRLMNTETHAEKIQEYANKDISNLIEIKKELEKEQKKLEKHISNGYENIKAIYEMYSIIDDDFSGKYFPKHIQNMSNISYAYLYNSLDKYAEPSSIKGTKKTEELIAPAREELAKATQQHYALIKRYLIIDEILDKWTSIILSNEIQKTSKKIQDEQNIISISEFNKIINQELRTQPAAYIYERIGERYSHYFIDEFQDTSIIQWQNLLPLINNAVSGTNDYGKTGTAMIVGDPKQSIYRFRGGDAKQFIHLSDESEKSPFIVPEKEVVRLQNNYRSLPEIINFNNQFFAYHSKNFINSAYINLYENFSAQTPVKTHGGFVSISLVDKDASEENPYLEKTLSIIKNCIKQGYKYSDITILCRKNDQAKMIANFLVENQLNIVSADSLLLSNSTEIQIIIQILKLSVQNQNKESLALLFYYLGKKKKVEEQLHNLLKIVLSTPNATENSVIEKHLHDFFDITFEFNQVRSLSLFESVKYIKTAVIDTINGSIIDSNYIQYFLDLVLIQSQNNKNSVTHFIEYWELHCSKLAVPSSKNETSIEITTIHKSKGLEFPIVILPFADNEIRYSKEEVWTPTDIEGAPEIIMPVTSKLEKISEKAAAIYHQAKDDINFDVINNLYVAFTRAEQHLYIISSLNTNNRANTSAYFIEFLEHLNLFEEDKTTYTFGECKNFNQTEIEKTTENKIFEVRNIDEKITKSQIKIATRESLLWENEQAKAIEKGTILHEILKDINKTSDIEKALIKAELKGWIVNDEIEEFKTLLIDVVTHPELTDFFNTENQIISETALLRKDTKTLIPDRVAINNNNAFILDYKTGVYNAKYKKQIDEYAAALEEMGYQIQKKLIINIQKKINIIHL